MPTVAVKFGRMSKKQREKVEDEVRMHKQLRDHGAVVSAAQDINPVEAYARYNSTMNGGSDYSASST